MRGVASRMLNQRFYVDTFKTDPRWSKIGPWCHWVTNSKNVILPVILNLCLLSDAILTLLIFSIVWGVEVVHISEVENILVLW